MRPSESACLLADRRLFTANRCWAPIVYLINNQHSRLQTDPLTAEACRDSSRVETAVGAISSDSVTPSWPTASPAQAQASSKQSHQRERRLRPAAFFFQTSRISQRNNVVQSRSCGASPLHTCFHDTLVYGFSIANPVVAEETVQGHMPL